MPEDYLEKALHLAGNSGFVECPDDGAWMAAEKDFGVRFPSPHKDFVSRFGTGVFGTDLYLLNPASSKPQLRLSIDYMREMRMEKVVGFARLEENHFPGTDGLIPIASTTSQVD